MVAGGGLAGVAAAIALCDSGARVTLAEARPRLGGATCSFTRDGRTVDNGQHIFLRCCTAYRGLLDRLGVTEKTALQERFDVRVLTPSGAARLRRRGLPAPLHLAGTLATYPLLSRLERAGVVRAALAFRRLNPADPATDMQRLGDWLAAHGQGPRARRALWDLFVVSSLNIAGDDASLALAAMVIKTALLGDPGAADIGVPLVPLGELHGQAADTLLRRLGATVLMGAKVTAVSPTPAGLTGRGGRGGFTVRLGGAAARRNPDLDGAAEAGLDYAPPVGIASGWSGPDGTASDGTASDGSDPGGEGPEHSLAADGVVLAVPPAQAAGLLPHRRPGRQVPPEIPRPGAASASRRSSTCTWSTTGPSPACASPPPSTRQSSGSSTRPKSPAADRASTSPCRCRRRTNTRASGHSGCVRPSCPRSSNCCRRRERRASPTSSSPGSGGPRSARFRVLRRSGQERPPRWVGSCWPARGPIPDGRTRWREPCGADLKRPGRSWPAWG